MYTPSAPFEARESFIFSRFPLELVLLPGMETLMRLAQVGDVELCIVVQGLEGFVTEELLHMVQVRVACGPCR